MRGKCDSSLHSSVPLQDTNLLRNHRGWAFEENEDNERKLDMHSEYVFSEAFNSNKLKLEEQDAQLEMDMNADQKL